MDRLAGEIKSFRVRAGLSQRELADRVGYTREYISRAERHASGVPSEELVRVIDSAVSADGVLLRLHQAAKVEQHGRRETVSDLGTVDHGDEIRSGVLRLRRVLNTRDLVTSEWAGSVEQLARAATHLTELRLQARYAQIARQVPDLLAAILSARPRDARGLGHTLTLAYRAADGLAFKYGYTDLSARLIELMAGAAENTGDELLLGAVSYVRTETFFATDDLEPAERILVDAVDRTSAKTRNTEAGMATRGSLHMRAAVVAARSGDVDAAREHLAEARVMAERVREGVYLGTAFGPDSVRVHDVSVNVDLGDSPTAVERAGTWRPPEQLPAERRSHYFIDLARAHVDVGSDDDAHEALRTARQIAPQHVRQHPHVRQSLATLIRRRSGQDPDLRNFARWVGLNVR